VQYILFPGRHHVLSTFQADYLNRLRRGECTDYSGEPIEALPAARVVFAVTSWDRSGTRRNPIAGHRREAAIELFGRDAELRLLTIPVPNVTPTPRFADVIVNAVDVHTGGRVALTPDNTIVASSTTDVIAMFVADGYRIAPVELDSGPSEPERFSTDRPWPLVEAIAAAGTLEVVSESLHPASAEIIDRYNLAPQIAELFADPLLGDEGDLTETRDYVIYAESFDRGADRKFDLVRDLVRPGRIVDIGCGTGALLKKLASAPELVESDLFGIEAARPLFEICEHRRTMGYFENENTFFYHRNVLNSPVLAPASIDTTITMALTHEVLSYLSPDAVVDMAQRIATQTRPGGVWINADVCGPDEPDTVVEFDLDITDGERDTDDRPTAELDDAPAYLGQLSTWDRWIRFTTDFRAAEREPVEWELVTNGTARATRRVLYEFLSKKDYVDNWLSEMHERFCALAYADWLELAADAGFAIAPGSRSYRNEWIVENRFRPVCSVRTLTGEPEDFGVTHLVLAATIL